MSSRSECAHTTCCTTRLVAPDSSTDAQNPPFTTHFHLHPQEASRRSLAWYREALPSFASSPLRQPPSSRHCSNRYCCSVQTLMFLDSAHRSSQKPIACIGVRTHELRPLLIRAFIQQPEHFRCCTMLKHCFVSLQHNNTCAPSPTVSTAPLGH